MRFERILIPVAILAVAAVAHLVGEGSYERPAAFSKPAELDRSDCRVGVLAGYDSEAVSRRVFPHARIVGFKEFDDAFMALLAGQIEGFVYNEHVLNVGLRAYPNRFKILDEPLSRTPSVVLVSKKRPELVDRLNAFIRTYRRLGIYADMFTRWCQADEFVPMPEIPEYPATNGVLRIGTSGTEEPSSFWTDSGELVGFDIEFARRFAQYLRLKPEIVCRPDDQILGELAAGELDMVIDDYNANETEPGMLVSDGYFDSDMKVLVKGGDDSGLMLGSTRLGYTRRLIRDPRVALFVSGFLTTLALTLVSALVGTLFALPLGALLRRLRGVPRTVVSGFLEVIRLLPPPVVLLLFGCVVLSSASAWTVAVGAFAFWFASFVAPVTGGEIRSAIPVVKTKLIELMQWTSVVGTLSICDLTMAADLVCGKSLAALGPLVSVAAAYLLMNWIVKEIGDFLERKLA